MIPHSTVKSRITGMTPGLRCSAASTTTGTQRAHVYQDSTAASAGFEAANSVAPGPRHKSSGPSPAR
jgi:hypothetical protein